MSERTDPSKAAASWAGSASWTFFDGAWREGDVPLLTAQSPAAWLGAVVFDGARAFDGVAPDLDLHCARVIASAKFFGLVSPLAARAIEELAWDGIARFPRDRALYVRPMIWAQTGFLVPDPDGARFALVISDMPLPPFRGFSAGLTRMRRPATDMAPTEAKASCLYPNVARAKADVAARGFEDAVVLDPAGNVAEFASANLWIVKNGTAITPAINGTFLNGITRQRTIQLLKSEGVPVEERRVTFDEVLGADEIFSSGNYGKIMPCTRIESRDLPIGPVTEKARDLYFAFARQSGGRRRIG